MATFTDHDFARLQRRANAGALTFSDAWRLLAEALYERGARKDAEFWLGIERAYRDGDVETT